MVHALRVVHSLLSRRGTLVELRKDRFASIRARHDQVYCLTGDRRLYAGPLEIKKPLADFRAADRAIREVVRHGLFRLEARDEFEIRFYYDSLAHIEKFAAESTYVTVKDPTRRRLSALLRRHPAAQILVVRQMRMNVLVKT